MACVLYVRVWNSLPYSFSVLVLTVASIVILALVWNNLFIKNWGLSPPKPLIRAAYGWASPQKKIIFVPKIITLTQLLTGRSLGPRILRFNRKTKLTKSVQKLSRNLRSEQSGGGRTIDPPPPEYTSRVSDPLHWRADGKLRPNTNQRHSLVTVHNNNKHTYDTRLYWIAGGVPKTWPQDRTP